MRNIFLVSCLVTLISSPSFAEEFSLEEIIQAQTASETAISEIILDKQQLAELVVEKSNMMEALSIITESMVGNSDEMSDIVFEDSMLGIDKGLYLKNASRLLASQFSEDELYLLLNFYSSETGKNIARKMPYFQAAMGKILENMIVRTSKEFSLE